MQRRLYRSREECMIFGVCGGIAEYLEWDPTLVRVLFVLGAVVSGGALVLGYIVLAIIMPHQAREGPITGEVLRENLEEMGGRARELGEEVREAFQRRPAGEGQEEGRPRPTRRSDSWLIGLILILAGAIFLLDNLRVFAWWQFGRLWPLILVAVGIALLLRRRER